MFDNTSEEMKERELKRLRDHRTCELIKAATKIATEGTWESGDDISLYQTARKFLLKEFEEHLHPIEVRSLVRLSPEELERMKKEFEEAIRGKVGNVFVGDNVVLPNTDEPFLANARNNGYD